MEATAAMATSILILGLPASQDTTTNLAPCLGPALIASSLSWGTLGEAIVLLLS
jgi:hypothetical protein